MRRPTPALPMACALALALALPACAPAREAVDVSAPFSLDEVAPPRESLPLPSTGADRAAPTAADADDSKMKHVWTSHDDPRAESAPADGSIARWNDDEWYIVHDYSEIGKQFLALQVGDVVRIDGKTVKITGMVDEPRDSYSNEVRAQVGDDVTIFQTCLGQTALHVVYGERVERSAPQGASGEWTWNPDPQARAVFEEMHGRAPRSAR